MLEISILAVIALAAVYWVAMWLLGRHEDVLYGSYVTPPQGAASDPAPGPIMLTRRPPPATPKPLSRPLGSAPLAGNSVAVQRDGRPAAGRASAPARTDALASLLETIKRDLNDAAGK